MLVDDLVDRAIGILNGKERVLITLAGIPGAGKSTIGKLVVDKLNERGIEAALVGMDGFHYFREDLANRIGEEKAKKFRGAPYTFESQGVVTLARELAKGGKDVSFPTFDHAVKDPVIDGGDVKASVKVVILEGLYLHLKDPEWSGIMSSASDTWFANVEFPVARERLARRHLQSGLVQTIEEGRERADTNDLVNGRYIIENSRSASLEFST